MAQSVGVGPGRRNGFVDLAREPDSSRRAFLLKVAPSRAAAPMAGKSLACERAGGRRT